MRVTAIARLKALRQATVVPRIVSRPWVPLAALHTSRKGLARVEPGPSRGYDILDKNEPGLKPDEEQAPPDQRTLKLGRTVRILQERLPTLLASPLPQDILSPQISLHLFPSTHPHLPTVSGRIPYTGALWTAPVAWGRLPVVGNVKLNIVSERMVRNGGSSVDHGCRDEKLIVKWKTCGKSKDKAATLYRGIGATEQLQKLTSLIGGESTDAEFCGLFIFEFDEDGRIVKHTIEHAEEGGNYDKTNKVVSVTDWLLGRAPWRKREEVIPGLAICHSQREPARSPIRRRSDHDR